MKFDKVMVIGLLILVIITMGAVSAADENASSDVVLGESPLEETGSFADLANLVENASSGQTVYLENDYVNDGSHSMGIEIRDAITVDGKNHTIDANRASNVFNVKNTNVILKNINFINTIKSAVNGTCTIYNCSFRDCSCDRLGGAIYTTVRGNAYGCCFVNCSAGAGGAIYNFNAYECSFVNCSANNGGGIVNGNANNCSFENCYATNSGGGVYFSAANGNVQNCLFVNCHSGGKGGGILYFGKLIVKKCSFENCSAEEIGGGIYATSNLEDCIFTNCHSGANGGAFYSYNTISNIRNCTFDNCSAVKYGGGLYSANANNCSFTDCSAGKNGAAIYNGNATDCSIIGWYAPGGPIYKGNAYNCTLLESPHIIISTDFALPNKNFDIEVAISENANGNVRIAVNNRTYTSTISSGKARVTADALSEGTYEIVASYDGNSNCSAQTVSSNLVVGKIYQGIRVRTSEKTCFGESTVIEVETAKDATGYVHILIEGKDYKAKITNGKAVAYVSGIKVGTHNFTATYGGNYKYYPEEASSGFEVLKATPMTSISAPSITYGNDATVSVEFSSYVNGFVKIIVNNKAVRTQIINHTANASFSGLGIGAYDVTAIYAGNSNYNAQTLNATFNVSKGTPIVSVSVKNIKVGHDAVINVKMADNVNGFVKITVNGNTKRVQIVNGTATLSVSGLKAGSYSASVVYAGSKNFRTQTKTAYFTVTKSKPRIQVGTTYYESPRFTRITVSINSDATGYLRVTYEGTTYRLAIGSNGNVYFDVDGIINRLTVVVAYGGNYKYTAVNETIKFPRQ